ncbi:MAG: arylamine N-acetyltransferase [Pseudomonadota bacterium]
MRLESYLHRIAWEGPLAPTRDTLGALMRAHVFAVPFENLDVQLGRPISLRVEDAYRKIVSRGRGGWCYEQNGVFGWALKQIGFRVDRVAAAAMRASIGPEAEANHLALLVTLPGPQDRWLADVGFGGGLLNPLPLAEATHHHAPFDVGLRALPNGRWEFFEQLAGEEVLFDFAPLLADEQAMGLRSRYLQTHPDSGFVKNLVCQLRRPGARVALRGRVYTELTQEGKTQRQIESREELLAVLRDPFGLEVPEAGALWDRICARHAQVFPS